MHYVVSRHLSQENQAEKSRLSAAAALSRLVPSASIHLTTVSNDTDDDSPSFRIDEVEKTIVANPDSPAVTILKLFATVWKGIGLQR
jgi:hypothetical protein